MKSKCSKTLNKPPKFQKTHIIFIDVEEFQFIYLENCGIFGNDEEPSIETRKIILKYAESNKLIIPGHHFS